MAFDRVLKVLSFLFLTHYLPNFVRGQPQVPCHFIFGDSLADPGNNNDLVALAQANYPPYGEDFVNGPTGRFTNNRTIVDIIGQLLGFTNFTPPFANLTGEDILKGLNYASAASGIRDDTGLQQGDRVTLNQQLANHLTIVTQIIGNLGNETVARQYLGQCIYTVITGNNDYINNYFLPVISITSKTYTLEQFTDLLAGQFEQQLRTLYDLGARKVAVFGVGLVGQAPEVRKRVGENDTDNLNAAAQLFNDKLLPLVNTLNSNLTGASFTVINTTGILLTSPEIGLQPLLDLNNTCCPTVPITGLCIPFSTPCTDRSVVAFYDGFHPTDVVNRILAGRAYNETLPLDASPYDILELALLP